MHDDAGHHPLYKNLQMPPEFDGEEREWVERPRRPKNCRRLAPLEKPGAKNFTYKTLPGEMFEEFLKDAGEYWRRQSNKKLKELTEAHNKKNPQKKRKLVQISRTDSKAMMAAILHMGVNKKSNFKDYWSQCESKKDKFIEKLSVYAKLSARKFRKMMSAIRLYDKADATEKKLNDKTNPKFDEHYKVLPYSTFYVYRFLFFKN